MRSFAPCPSLTHITGGESLAKKHVIFPGVIYSGQLRCLRCYFILTTSSGGGHSSCQVTDEKTEAQIWARRFARARAISSALSKGIDLWHANISNHYIQLLFLVYKNDFEQPV